MLRRLDVSLTDTSSYTPTTSGWGVEFVAVVLLLAAVLWVLIVTVRLIAATLRARRTDPLTPPRPLNLRGERRR